MWNPAARKEVQPLAGHTGPVNAVVITADGKRIVSASEDGTLRAWNPVTGRTRSLMICRAPVRALAIADGGFLVSGAADGTLRVWEPVSGYLKHVLPGHTAPVTALAAPGVERLVVSTAADGTLRVWNVAVGHGLAEFTADAPLTCCAVTPDGRTVVAGDEQGRVYFLSSEE